MRIAFFEIEDWQRGLVGKSLAGQDLNFFDQPLTAKEAELAAEAEIVSVFVFSRVTREVIERLPNLKLITTRSMGYDHIDLAACRERGITVCSVPNYGDRTVAEHALALMLAVSRQIYRAYERTEKAVFDYHGLQGFDLYGKTLGIVGGGRIGLNVARMAKGGFDMKVLVADPRPRPDLAAEIGFDYAPLDELLAESDVISLHVPLLPATAYLINRETIAKMKPGVVLINTARGGLVDSQALIEGLERHVIGGAGLDVLEEETFDTDEIEPVADLERRVRLMEMVNRNRQLIARDDVIITPHVAFNSREAVRRIIETTIGNINAFLAGQPVNLVKAD